MAAISPVVGQPPTEYMGSMVKEGAKLEAKIYGGIGVGAGAIGGLIMGAAAGRGAGAVGGLLAGGLIGGAVGAGYGAIGGAIDGALATAGTGILNPKTDEQFKTSAGVGAAVGGLLLGTVSAIATKKLAAALPGMVLGAGISYFVGREIGENTLERG